MSRELDPFMGVARPRARFTVRQELSQQEPMGGRRITPAAEDITGQEKSQQADGKIDSVLALWLYP